MRISRHFPARYAGVCAISGASFDANALVCYADNAITLVSALPQVQANPVVVARKATRRGRQLAAAPPPVPVLTPDELVRFARAAVDATAAKTVALRAGVLAAMRAPAPLPKVDDRADGNAFGRAEAQQEAAAYTAKGAAEDRDAFFGPRRQAPVNMPPFGTVAYTARMLFESGAMTGEEADAWKDRQKDLEMGL